MYVAGAKHPEKLGHKPKRIPLKVTLTDTPSRLQNFSKKLDERLDTDLGRQYSGK
jgi:hypothetical protein